jgi:hypothetical protein
LNELKGLDGSGPKRVGKEALGRAPFGLNVDVREVDDFAVDFLF